MVLLELKVPLAGLSRLSLSCMAAFEPQRIQEATEG